MAIDPNRKLPPSEFGGDAGLIQPREKGHQITPAEEKALLRRTNGEGTEELIDEQADSTGTRVK